MRVLMIEPGPAFSVADVARGWAEGLEAAGCEVGVLNYGDMIDFYCGAYWEHQGDFIRAFDEADGIRLAARQIKVNAYDFWPDIVLIVSGFFTPGDLVRDLRSHGHKVVLLATESPYEEDKQVALGSYCDLTVLNDPTNLDRYDRAVYIPHAYSPQRHYRRDPDPGLASDVAFAGTGYPSRIKFLEQVEWGGIDLSLAGMWRGLDEGHALRDRVVHDIDECCPNEVTHRLYASTKMSFNLYRKEANSDDLIDGWAMGPREVELAAAGVFFLREHRPEGDEILGMLPTFDTPDEFTDKMRWWLANDALRSDRALEAKAAIADRTFENNAKQLIRTLS